MTTARYIVGDVLDVLAEMPKQSVDLVMTSPPFLALRSYLPADHPDKSKEIGSEATPAEFIDTLLDVVEECARVLTPHGSLVFELGDTYAGSGGAGGDYDEGGFRDGQPKFKTLRRKDVGAPGWPWGKSLCFVPQLFGASLAYGRNLLSPERTTEPWRVRNVIAWCRPNPPVGALSDKCRPATSYLTVATKARDRWFDMDAARVPFTGHKGVGTGIRKGQNGNKPEDNRPNDLPTRMNTHAGAPLLDWWEIPTQPYRESHYATFPDELARRVILLMCPTKVCLECGEPSRRIVETVNATGKASRHNRSMADRADGPVSSTDFPDFADRLTTGWTDCRHNAWRPGLVLDPFAGSGTTLAMAQGNGRSSIGVDIDSRNADLARDRVGPLYLEVEQPEVVA